ncbi:type II secretion system F family protein [bacterium]|nr:type II secretion system F family protein [bacterium]
MPSRKDTPNAGQPQGKTEPRSSLQEALARKAGLTPEKDAPLSREGEALDVGAAPAAGEMVSGMSKPISLFGPNFLERAVFCRQFATLIQVGIPVLKSLQMLARRTSNGRLRSAIYDAARGVEEGEPIHQSLARNERTFSPLVVSIVRIGEVGGILEESLRRLADIMESKARIRRMAWSAAMYPIVAICVAIMVVMVVMVKAIPTFAEVYKNANVDLPTPTRVIIAMSDFLVVAWPFVIVGLIAAVIALSLWGRTSSGRRFYSWIGLRIPIMSAINRKIAVARSCRTLGGLVSAGIPLTDGIKITGDSSENLLVADAWYEVHDEVERGGRMNEPLAQARIFPPVVVDMIAIGEETGTLDTMLNKIADTYDTEVQSTLAGLASIIEPLLIILLGGVVIFIATAVLLPYFKMATVVGNS